MKKQHKPNNQFRYQDHCIFCGKIPLSHEEIYAEWIREYIKTTQTKTKHTSTYQLGSGPKEEVVTNKPGSPYVQTLKIVCKKCNNGWMSDIQNKTKPILLPMLQGKGFSLSDEQRKQLAIWVTMFVIVYEYRDKKTISVKQTERDSFYENPEPLKNWHIFCSAFDTTIEHQLIHHRGFGFSEQHGGNNSFDTQITVFSIGKITFTCFSSTNRTFEEFMPRRATGVLSELGYFRIWPSGSYQAISGPKLLTEKIISTIIDNISNRWFTEPDDNLYVITNTY